MLQPPKRYTFEQPRLKMWVERWCFGNVLNLFAGKIKLNVNEIRVDLDKNMPADYHADAFSFLYEWSGDKFDTIVFDPPYNLRKAREKYKGRHYGSLVKIKDLIPSAMNLGGRVIHLGYDTVGLGGRRGFEKKACCLVCHGGDHNDTIGLVEEYIRPDLFAAQKELYSSVRAATNNQSR